MYWNIIILCHLFKSLTIIFQFLILFCMKEIIMSACHSNTNIERRVFPLRTHFALFLVSFCVYLSVNFLVTFENKV